MNVTKNKLIEALNYLGEFPKTSLRKDELIEELNKIYGRDIEQLVVIINVKIYNLIKRLVKSEKNGIYVESDYEPEVDFLESILIIEEPIIINEKIYIRFREGMKNKFTKFINDENENNVKKNQTIVDLIINIVDVYGLIRDYEMLDMINKLLNCNMKMTSLFGLINLQVDLRSEIIIGDSDDDNEIYLMTSLIDNPDEIIYERETSDLYYKEYTIQELEKNTLENLMERKEAQEVLKFLKKKKFKFAEEATISLIVTIMNMSKTDINEFMNLIKIDFEDIDEANEYLQLIMNLHNNIPHYSLYGYSPNELFKKQYEQHKKEEEKRKTSKIGRNAPCPCGSGKKYKNCCLNKVVEVDFRHEKNKDCIEEEDSRMFFVLKNLLLDYTNKKYKINNELEDIMDVSQAEPEEIREIRDKLWEDSNVIKEYLKENPNRLNEDLISIIEEWNKKKINKEFILYKYEDEYAVFIDDNNIYYVKGLKDSIRDMIPEQKLPTFVKTVLLPLKNQIIYDSYIIQYNMSFGNGIRKIWDENYKKLLKENKVKYEL